MVHNVFVWQKEKTNLVKAFRTQELNTTTNTQNLNTSNGVIIGNGHLNNTGMGNLSFHSMTAGGAYTHPITLLQQGGPYIIRWVVNINPYFTITKYLGRYYFISLKTLVA